MWFDLAGAAWRRDPAGVVQRATTTLPEAREALAGVTSLDAWMATLKKLPAASRSAIAASFGADVTGGEYVFAPMTPGQVGNLAKRGHEIASHAVTHPILPSLNDAELGHELRHTAELSGCGPASR